MACPGKVCQGDGDEMGSNPDRDGRAKRLSTALRANLKRRKQPVAETFGDADAPALQRRVDPLSPAALPAKDPEDDDGA